jgi:predicted DNA binding protein
LLEAHLAIRTPGVWNETIVQGHGAAVTILDWMHQDACCCKVFVEIRVEPGKEGALLEDLSTNPSVHSQDLEVVEAGILKGALSTDECLGHCAARESRVFQLEGRFLEDGRLLQVVAAPEREVLRELVSRLERDGHEVSLVKLATLEREELLTSRQEDLLLTALERGFFDDPKGTSLKDLAETFGVSISTASEIIRKATYKIMSCHFDAVT